MGPFRTRVLWSYIHHNIPLSSDVYTEFKVMCDAVKAHTLQLCVSSFLNEASKIPSNQSKVPMCFFLFFFFFLSFLPLSPQFFCFVRLPFDRSWSFNRAGTWTGRLDLWVWISCVCDVHVCMGVYWGSAGVWSGNVSSCRG